MENKIKKVIPNSNVQLILSTKDKRKSIFFSETWFNLNLAHVLFITSCAAAFSLFTIGQFQSPILPGCTFMAQPKTVKNCYTSIIFKK